MCKYVYKQFFCFKNLSFFAYLLAIIGHCSSLQKFESSVTLALFVCQSAKPAMQSQPSVEFFWFSNKQFTFSQLGGPWKCNKTFQQQVLTYIMIFYEKRPNLWQNTFMSLAIGSNPNQCWCFSNFSWNLKKASKELILLVELHYLNNWIIVGVRVYTGCFFIHLTFY